jgi:hypothetical protein
MAGVLHGSALATFDVDICPDPAPENLERLCDALRDMHARVRTADDEVDFDCHPALLQQLKMLNLATDFGTFDLSFRPASFSGYDDLASDAITMSIAGAAVTVASLDDVIRSKEAAGRVKDQVALPQLYALRDEIARQERERG